MYTKNMENNCYLNKSATLFALGDLKEFGKLTLMVSLVYLQGKWGWFCSPLMKLSNLSHKMMASLEDLYFPLPHVTWSVHIRSSMQNDPKEGFCTLSLNAMIRLASFSSNTIGSVCASPSSAVDCNWSPPWDMGSGSWTFTKWSSNESIHTIGRME